MAFDVWLVYCNGHVDCVCYVETGPNKARYPIFRIWLMGRACGSPAPEYQTIMGDRRSEPLDCWPDQVSGYAIACIYPCCR